MESIEALALVGGYVNDELLVRNEYLAAENEILKFKIDADKPIKFNNEERIRLAKIGNRLGLKALKDLSCIVKPETLLKWFRDLVAKKSDGSNNRKAGGRPQIDPEIEKLILQLVDENPGWGYDRIADALANLGITISDQTVGNILKKYGVAPAPKRDITSTWHTFIKNHQDVLAACDFFTTEVLTATGLVTFYVLFFIHIGTRKVYIAGITPNPDQAWMNQIARNLTMETWGFLSDCKYLILDRDTKYCDSFRSIIKSAGIKIIRLPPKSPNLNAYAERFVRSIKDECLSKLIFFGEASLSYTIQEYVAHYHAERNHQGKDHRILFPDETFHPDANFGPIACKQRIGGLLKYYYRHAA